MTRSPIRTNNRPGAFFDNIEENDGCWNWTGSVAKGHGVINFLGSSYFAHRISYQGYVGRLYRDQVVLQTCGNHLCVQPGHLALREASVSEEW